VTSFGVRRFIAALVFWFFGVRRFIAALVFLVFWSAAFVAALVFLWIFLPDSEQTKKPKRR